MESAEQMNKAMLSGRGTGNDVFFEDFIDDKRDAGKQQSTGIDYASLNSPTKMTAMTRKDFLSSNRTFETHESIPGHSQCRSRAKHSVVKIPESEEGRVPEVTEIILTTGLQHTGVGNCLYRDMWTLENRSHAIVVGYVDSIPESEDIGGTTAAGKAIKRPCPSAVLINNRPLLAFIKRLIGINSMPTPCL